MEGKRKGNGDRVGSRLGGKREGSGIIIHATSAA